MKNNLQAELTRIGELNAKLAGLPVRFCRGCSQDGIKSITFEWESRGELDEPLIGDVKAFLLAAPTLFACFEQAMAVNQKLVEQIQRCAIWFSAQDGGDEIMENECRTALAYAEANGLQEKGG